MAYRVTSRHIQPSPKAFHSCARVVRLCPRRITIEPWRVKPDFRYFGPALVRIACGRRGRGGCGGRRCGCSSKSKGCCDRIFATVITRDSLIRALLCFSHLFKNSFSRLSVPDFLLKWTLSGRSAATDQTRSGQGIFTRIGRAV